jgi:hypothetical protein
MKAGFLLLFMAHFSQVGASESLRLWTSNDGKFSTKAQYVEVKGNSVLLLKDDGRLVNVPFARLSKADNIYIAQAIQRGVRASSAPPPTGIAAPIAEAPGPAVPPAAPVVPPKINVVLGEDDQLKARNDQAAVDNRQANLRSEQRGVDSDATALNTRLAAIEARGRQIQVEGQQINQQILAHESEISRRNLDIQDARANGAWDIVNNHHNQLALLRDRVATLQQHYAQLNGEYSGLEQEASQIRQQVAALESKFYAIEGEIAASQNPPPPGGPGEDDGNINKRVEELMANDVNGDGKLRRSEMPRWLERERKLADRNLDSALDRAEIKQHLVNQRARARAFLSGGAGK